MSRSLGWLVVVMLGWASSGAVAAPEAKAPPKPGPWKLTWVAGLNLSQSNFSENWAGGDKGSIVWVLNSDAKAQRQFGTRYALSNHLQLAYGQTVQQQPDPADPDRLIWASPRKSNDQIRFESVSRFTLGGWVDPYAALRLEGQFVDESSSLGSILLSPIKLTESAGVARVVQKTDDRELITRLGFGFRETFARQFDPVTAERVSVATTDGGIEWQTSATQPLFDKKVLFEGQLRVFQPLFFSKSEALDTFDRDALAFDPGRESIADFWKAPNVDVQGVFSAQITKVLAVNLAAQWVYLKFDPATDIDNTKPVAERIPAVDHGVRKAGQFREALAIGITYTLF
jgi:hypothetical protein